MAAPNEVQAAMIMVAGNWAKYLDETVRSGDHKRVLGRLIERYKDIRVELDKVNVQYPIKP